VRSQFLDLPPGELSPTLLDPFRVLIGCIDSIRARAWGVFVGLLDSAAKIQLDFVTPSDAAWYLQQFFFVSSR
jgi:hypothetical protein